MENKIESLPKVSVVIPVKDGEKYISQCLKSIFNQQYPTRSIEVIIVDNESSDRTPEIANRFNLIKSLKVVYTNAKTIAGVRNFGASHANGEVLAFLDVDCEPDPNWLQAGVELLLKDAEVACVGFKDRPRDTTDPWVERAWQHISSTAKTKKTTNVSWLPTFNLIVWRHIFNEVSGFNEELETCEDADFGYRVAVKYKLLLSNRSTVYHKGDPKTLKDFFFKEYWRGSSNFKSFLKSPNKLYDFRSVFIPIAYLLLLFSALMCLSACTFLSFSVPTFKIFLTLLLIIIVTPIVFVFIKGSNFKDSKIILQSSLLIAVYLIARGLAILRFNCKK